MSKPLEDSPISLPVEVIRDLLTPSEMRMLKNRWRILQLLQSGLTIRSIASQVKVGTDTVVRVSKLVGRVGFQESSGQSKTPWVFGKSEK
ncbi:MAG: Trp family transcriptional regulator [Candidatus Daviesbacteria bacterium]|nr:Trp family transcriptional regulator [Candidatus Daviesbacteria bacterium]